jgi:pyruvate ferredoxin oxidoreductase beta subunit
MGDVRVVAQGGDGGTTDIGFGCLSGMFERNDDVLYICYDNGGYMNTGVQRSSATPPAARTATTMPVGPGAGQRLRPGQVPAGDRHGARDSLRRHGHGRRPARPRIQGRRAMTFRGARYIHILVPCPLGWGAASHDTIKLARLAKETGIFPVFEAEHGELTTSTKIRRRCRSRNTCGRRSALPTCSARTGRRYTIARLQALADKNIRKYGSAREGGELMKSRLPSPSTPARRSPTAPARGAPSGRSISTAAALQQPVPGRRRHPGLAVPRRIGNYEKPPGGT